MVKVKRAAQRLIKIQSILHGGPARNLSKKLMALNSLREHMLYSQIYVNYYEFHCKLYK